MKGARSHVNLILLCWSNVLADGLFRVIFACAQDLDSCFATSTVAPLTRCALVRPDVAAWHKGSISFIFRSATSYSGMLASCAVLVFMRSRHLIATIELKCNVKPTG